MIGGTAVQRLNAPYSPGGAHLSVHFSRRFARGRYYVTLNTVVCTRRSDFRKHSLPYARFLITDIRISQRSTGVSNALKIAFTRQVKRFSNERRCWRFRCWLEDCWLKDILLARR